MGRCILKCPHILHLGLLEGFSQATPVVIDNSGFHLCIVSKNFHTEQSVKRVDKRIPETPIRLDDGHESPVGSPWMDKSRLQNEL
jgi:hypothetical protein